MAVCGFARGFYAPAIFGIMSDIIPRNLYGSAVGWNSALWQASAVLGPCLGGLLYVYFSPVKIYLLSAVILIGAFLFFIFVKIPHYF